MNGQKGRLHRESKITDRNCLLQIFFIISQGSFYFAKGKSGKIFKTDVCGCHVEGNKPVLTPPGWEISLKLSM